MRRVACRLFWLSLFGLTFGMMTVRAAMAGNVNPVLAKEEIRQAEQRLSDLGYWAGPVDGVWDEASRNALVAFQKVAGARATGKLTRAEWNALLSPMPGVPRP